MIGVKSLAVAVMFAAAVAAAIAFRVLSPERMMMRGEDTLLFVGAFGTIVGTLAHRFWRLGERSKHYLRWSTEKTTAWDVSEAHFLGGERRRIVVGDNREGHAVDIPSWGHQAIAIALASLLALACLDSRAIDRFARAGKGIASATSSFCPEEEEPKPPAKDPNEPGCELVRRAYALGYAKSLGTCAPKEKAKEEKPERAEPTCTRRQRDEPVLHYSYRLLSRFFRNLGDATRGGYVAKAKKDWNERTAHLPAIRASHRQTLLSAPHASHHVFTNLPDPGDAFRRTTCANDYLKLPHRPSPPAGPMRSSKLFEHVMAQLLFEPTYDAPAGHCREYHVHWGSPPDACARLAASPESFLAERRALDDVKAVLERHRIATELTALGGPPPGAEPGRFVSFQCYVEGDGGAVERRSMSFTLENRPFTAEEIRAPRPPSDEPVYVGTYDAVGKLFVKGFHYGLLLSEAGIETNAPGAAAGIEASFSSDRFLLTRLYGLENVDIYLEPGWLAHRPDLLEVYPYERHLRNYVQTFRRRYRIERGRL